MIRKPNKRGEVQTSVMLEAVYMVLGFVVVIMIFGIIIWLVMNVWGPEKEDSTTNSFNILAGELKDLKDGEKKEIPVYMESDYMILGFEENLNTVSGSCYADGYGRQFILFDGGEFSKPTTKCKGDGCICLYKVKVIDGKRYLPATQYPDHCVSLKQSVKGGTFDLRREYVDTPYEWIIDGIFGTTKDKTTMTCEFGMVPAIGKVVIATALREGDNIYLCWGDNCRSPASGQSH